MCVWRGVRACARARACVCVCVCECVRERESVCVREREREKFYFIVGHLLCCPPYTGLCIVQCLLVYAIICLVATRLSS